MFSEQEIFWGIVFVASILGAYLLFIIGYNIGLSENAETCVRLNSQLKKTTEEYKKWYKDYNQLQQKHETLLSELSLLQGRQNMVEAQRKEVSKLQKELIGVSAALAEQQKQAEKQENKLAYLDTTCREMEPMVHEMHSKSLAMLKLLESRGYNELGDGRAKIDTK